MHTKKNPEAAEDELITALFYLYQEALKKKRKAGASHSGSD